MATHAIATRFRIVLVDYFADANFSWHMRVLLVHGGGAQWIAATPDHDLELLDLTQFRVIPLRSGERFPQRTLDNVYAFDEFEAGEEDALARSAQEYATAVGFAAAPRSRGAGTWLISDTAHSSFGETIPADAMDDEDSVVIRGAAGVAKVDEAWVTVERVEQGGEEAWRRLKATGPGRDRRIIGEVRDTRGKRFVSETDAMLRWKGTVVPDTPLQGPPVVLLFFEGLRAAGLTLLEHHADWRQKSGIHEKSAVCREHHLITEALRLEVTVDQLDITQLISAEFRVRRMLQIEMAVERSAKAPDFEGLDFMLSSTVSPSGAIVTEKFTEWLTNRQRDQAHIMKQGRLLREERVAESKKKKHGGEGGPPEGGG